MADFVLGPTSHLGRPVPDSIPGRKVDDPEQLYHLKAHLNRLFGRGEENRFMFPGSQPVSFDYHSLKLLEQEDFWVCEKSDGVRVLVMIVATEAGQETYLIDRKEDFYQNYDLVFPHQDGPSWNHSDTVLDAELVIDVDPDTNFHQLRLLTFDCMVIDSESLIRKPLSSRFGRLKAWIIEPYNLLIKSRPDLAAQQPFQVVLKRQELAYGILAVFQDHLPSLQHGNDGLIFTSAESPYTPGTDRKILKWKPPSENSIDFLLQLKFPALPNDESSPDFSAKPKFMLMMNCGRDPTICYDTMEVEDQEWENWKESGEQYDDRVVEVAWDKSRSTWKLLRFRDDKREGNYKDVVSSIVTSINDGVEAEVLVSRASAIKKAFQVRKAKKEADDRERERRDRDRREGDRARQGASNGSTNGGASNGAKSNGGMNNGSSGFKR